MKNFKEWMIKSIFARQGHIASKAEVTQNDMDPQYYGGKLRIPDVGYVGDVYVKLPLKNGFNKMDMATKRRIAASLVTPDNFRDLFAPDLTSGEWNWLPNHDLETIMKYRWLKNNTNSISVSDYREFAMVYLGNEPTDDLEHVNREWAHVIKNTTPDKLHVQFDDDPSAAWLNIYVLDVLSPNFDWKALKAESIRKENKRKEKEAERKAEQVLAEQKMKQEIERAANTTIANAIAGAIASMAENAPVLIDTGIVPRDQDNKRDRDIDENKDDDEEPNSENKDEPDTKKIKDDPDPT